MAIAPAVGLGMLVVFLVGTGVTFLILSQVIKRMRVAQALRPDAHKKAGLDKWTDGLIDKISIAGGIAAVGLLIASFFILPREWFYGAWIGLTVLGVLFGIFTFFISGSSNSRPIWPEKEAPRSAETPPAREVARGAAAPPPPPPPATDNPYLKLLIKVRYDTALAERLIDYERKRAPNATVDELCRNAIARLEHDNR